MFVHCSWTNRTVAEVHTWVEWLYFFLLIFIFCACLLGSGLKLIFNWKAQSLLNSRSVLISLAEALTSWTTENKEMSSANNFCSLLRSFDQSLIYIANNRGPRVEPWGTPTRVSTQNENLPFKITLCFCWSRSHVLY